MEVAGRIGDRQGAAGIPGDLLALLASDRDDWAASASVWRASLRVSAALSFASAVRGFDRVKSGRDARARRRPAL